MALGKDGIKSTIRYPANYDWVSGLSIWSQPKLLRGVFSILLVSLLMTIFETGFYMKIIEPQTRAAVKDIVSMMQSHAYYQTKNELSKQTWYSPITFMNPENVDMADAFLDTNKERERLLINKINQYAYITASFMVFILFMGLVMIHSRLSYIQKGSHNFEVFGADYYAAIITAVLTVVLLASFQVLFFFFGKQFKFLGTKGTEELRFKFNNFMRKNLDMPILT